MGSLRYELTEAQWRRIAELLRFVRWAEAGVWDRLFDDLVTDRKNPYLMLGSTIVRAHQQAATDRKKGAKDKALGVPEVAPAVAGWSARRSCARRSWLRLQRHRRGHRSYGSKSRHPMQINRKVQRPHDRTLYKLRNRIERCFNQLKQFRRLATRYCKRKICFHATVSIACSALRLKQYVDTA